MENDLTRREFIGRMAALSAAATVGLNAEEAADLPIGIQLYSVRTVLGKDFKEGLKKVAEIGYRHFEFAGYGNLSAAELTEVLKTLGVTVCGTHEGYEGLLKNTDAVLEFNQAIGNRFVVVPMMPGMGRSGGVEEVKKFAQSLSTIGEKARQRGLQLCYHNHSFEFEKIDGERTIWEVLFSTADAELVKAELDVAWAFNAGVDPVELMDRYADRIVLLHMKDLDEQKRLAPVGEGVIPMEKVIKKAHEIGVKWFIVEQDQPRAGKDILDEIAVSYRNLVKLLS